MVINPGEKAPRIEATNQDGTTISPDFEDPTVMYFYPRDGTPGCQLEARQFEAAIDSFREHGITIYGVSLDDVDSHKAFVNEENLSFDLLADPTGNVAAAFDIDTSGDFADRITVILAAGEVQSIVDADDVNPDGHATDVLQESKSLLKGQELR